MKSNLKHFCYVLLLFLFSLTLFGCGDSTTTAAPIVTTTEEPVVTTTQEPVITTTTVEAIDISKVKFYNGNFTYDGEAKSIYVSKRTIPEGVTVEYEGNEKTEVGEYTVTATLKDSAGNVLGTISAKLTINKVKKNISKVEFEDTAYDWLPNTTFKLEASEIPTGVKAEYENNTLTEVGSIEATCKLYDEFDNELLATLTATLKVKYAVVNDEDVFTSQTFLVDGEDHAITLDATKASEYTSIVYTNNSARVQGYYHASALVTEADGDMFEYHAILTLDNPVNEAFEDYADEMFVYFLSGDQSTLNIFMVDYESYGFEHEEATWYSYEPYTDEDYASDLEEIARLKEEFSAFDRSTLSFYQQDTYDKISGEINDLDFLITNKDLLLMRQTYVDQFGGYAADLPTTLEAYNIRRVEDIEDIISYVASVEDAFATYDDYCLARAEAGYGFTNFTIAGMVKYLDGVSGRIEIKDEETGEVTNAGPYYLIALLENKIKASQETLKLTDDQINAYIEQLDAAFVKFINAHKTLAEDLLAKCLNLSLKDKDYYLTSYGEDGKKLYEYLLRSRIGIDMEIEDYISFLDTVIKKYFVLYSDYKAVGNSAAIKDGEVQILDSNEPDDIVEWLKEFAKTIVPDLASTPEIDIAYMDKTVTANTTTLAYYMKSPLDSFSNEYIHLNGDALGDDYLETVKTLGHEGYPGHLYAYVYSKENPNISNLIRVSTCTGHGEGWAKYVETAICDYIAKTKNKADWTVAMMQSKYWDLFVYAIYARVDVGLGYEEWGVDDVVKFFKNCNLVMDEDGAKELMQDLCEMPSTYAAYGYGQAYFYEIHTEAKTILGEDYNEVEFNDMLLSHGWLDLYKLEDLYAQYMSNKCFLLGIDYE